MVVFPSFSHPSSHASAEHFDALAERWWQRGGSFSMLHKMQPVRMRYLRRQLVRCNLTSERGDLQGLRVLDIGCGGGLMSEPLARLGAQVTAVDKSADSIAAAREHAEAQGLSIDYRHAALEELEETENFDLLCAMEVIEHVPSPQNFLMKASAFLKDEGLLILSTLNRTYESWLKGIVVAEQLLQIVPRGCHDWKKFVAPTELARWGEEAGLELSDLCGMRYRLAERDFVLDPDSLLFNYIAALRKERR